MQASSSNAISLANDWQQQLADAISTVPELCAYLQLDQQQLPVSPAAVDNFALRVPQCFADCMEKGNPKDPLLRQVLPVNDEMRRYPGFRNDPVGDIEASTAEGVIHKYQGRVLLIMTGGCAINCRYCFRRNFPYSELQLSRKKEDAALNYIYSHPEINEVILSGGDPLLLNDQRLLVLFEKLSHIPHLTRIRIHSRLPIVLPSRITQELSNILTQSTQQIVLVVHCNHPHEISPAVISACARLTAENITLLNQSVLLKEVNDNVELQCQLSEKLFATGILPYYLHLLDKANGTGHFQVPRSFAVTMMQEVQKRLPGYLVPKLVAEQAGALSKLAIHY